MKQFFSYFKWLFITLAAVFVVFIIVLLICGPAGSGKTRKNHEAPTQRVYDYADKLTDEEEEWLENQIAESEAKIACDIVLVVIDEPVVEKYGYTTATDRHWNYSMMNYADDFYDQNNFGFDKVHGDGVLLLDNYYMEGTSQSQAGSWLSTCGRVYERYSTDMIDEVLDDVYFRLESSSAYWAYSCYVTSITREMSYRFNIPWFVVICAPLLIAGIFIATHLKIKEGSRTTGANTYVESNSIKYNERSDQLIDKIVTSRVISTSSSGGGGGRGGGHRSSGGVRHGGGGRRR